MGSSSSSKRNLAILVGLSLGAMHIINRVQTTSACSKIPKLTREYKSYEWRYGNISYRKKGSGSPLLLIHDLTIGSNKEEFSLIFSELSKKHTVYAFDFLGYGDSDKPSMTYTASVYEQLISDFIKNVISSKTDIVVTGDSSPIVLKLSHNNNELINRIIMINPLGLYDQNLIPSNQTRLMKFVIDMPIVGTYSYNLTSSRSMIEKTFKEKYLYDSDSFSASTLDTLIDIYFRASHNGGHEAKYSYASFLSKYMTCSVLHELKEINNSILIIGGKEEPEIDNNIENYLYYNNAIESILIPNTTHLPHIEKPSETIENIEVFLS